MREISLGPVRNPDGSPTELTKQMLAGTGRDPDEFARPGGPRQHIIPVAFEVYAEDESLAAKLLSNALAASKVVGGYVESWWMPNHSDADGSDDEGHRLVWKEPE